MKFSFLIYSILFIAFAKTGLTQNQSSQSSQVTGIYTLDNNSQGNKGVIATWNLELSADGSFHYHFYRKLEKQQEENFYAEGTYTINDLIINFSPNTSQSSTRQLLDFKGTKARILKKHPRNKSLKNQPTFILFITSREISIKGLKLYKKDA